MTAADTLQRRGLMLILSSPSGAGKTTIARMLLERDPEIRLSVSATTRPIRPGEVDGRDYHFVGTAEFARMIEADEFYEWAEVFGHRYGTLKAHIRAGLKDGFDFLFDIDWQGTQQLYQKDQQDVVRVFILPPSISELRQRLSGRGTDSLEVIEARMAKARSEISHGFPAEVTESSPGVSPERMRHAQSEIGHWDGYDYVLINDDAEACLAKVQAILAAERMKRARQTGLIGFVRELMGAPG